MSNETGGSSLAEWPAAPAAVWVPAPAQAAAEPPPPEPPPAEAPLSEPPPGSPVAEPSAAEPAAGPAVAEAGFEALDAEPGALFPAPAALEPAPPELDGEQLRAALEAVLLVVDEPVTESALAEAVEQPADRVAGALDALAAEYTATGRGFDLRRAAGGWRLYTRPEQARYVERFVLDGQQARLTQAALETLAVIAYRQPVTRSRVSAIRGVNCDGVVRTLMTRGLVEETGTEPETGAHLYRTTMMFLEKLGLDSLDQLPPLAPFLPDDFEALDPDAPDTGSDTPRAREPEALEPEALEPAALEPEAIAPETPEVGAPETETSAGEIPEAENMEPENASG